MKYINDVPLGYWYRRLLHVAMAIIPLIYYWYSVFIEDIFYLSRDKFVSCIIIFILIFEAVRYKKGWLLYGQRAYEADQISALAWTAFSVGLVLLAAPKMGRASAAIGAPLIWSLAVVDPLMGELRRLKASKLMTFLIACSCVAAIWLASVFWLQTPWLLLPLVIPLTVLSEWIKTPSIDDNALILLVPLSCIFILLPWC